MIFWAIALIYGGDDVAMGAKNTFELVAESASHVTIIVLVWFGLVFLVSCENLLQV